MDLTVGDTKDNYFCFPFILDRKKKERKAKSEMVKSISLEK
jgi:hypothetical protein